MSRKVAWLLCMVVLTMVLAGIVISRAESKTDIIFGGIEGAYVRSYSYVLEQPGEKTSSED